MRNHFRRYFSVVAMSLLSAVLISCGTTNPNSGRVLTNITVTPGTADAQTFPNGQVTFTANGNFSLPPLNAPVTFTTPYAGSFVVDNPTGQTIATVVSSGTGTITVQCATGASGSVQITASAASNNFFGTVVSANATLTCP